MDLREIPELVTPRLRLLAPAGDDLDSFHAMMSDPEVTRFKGGPSDRGGAWAGLANMLGHWALRGHGLLVGQTRSDGLFAGTVGVIRPEGWPAPEITWTLPRNLWGQGLATEAAMTVRDWAFQTLRLTRVVSMIHAENRASIRIAERLGMEHTGQISAFGDRVELYQLEKVRLDEGR